MRIRPGALVLLPFVAGCAAVPESACESATPPAAAEIRVTQGVGLAFFPAAVPSGFTGCQRIWIGDPREPGQMQVLATKHFVRGMPTRFTGRQPGGAAYECRYEGGVLDVLNSSGGTSCPSASELQGEPP
jgi:hypothetical protein